MAQPIPMIFARIVCKSLNGDNIVWSGQIPKATVPEVGGYYVLMNFMAEDPRMRDALDEIKVSEVNEGGSTTQEVKIVGEAQPHPFKAILDSLAERFPGSRFRRSGNNWKLLGMQEATRGKIRSLCFMDYWDEEKLWYDFTVYPAVAGERPFTEKIEIESWRMLEPAVPHTVGWAVAKVEKFASEVPALLEE